MALAAHHDIEGLPVRQHGDPAIVVKGVDLPDREYTVDAKLTLTLRLMQDDKHVVSKEGWLNSARLAAAT